MYIQKHLAICEVLREIKEVLRRWSGPKRRHRQSKESPCVLQLDRGYHSQTGKHNDNTGNGGLRTAHLAEIRAIAPRFGIGIPKEAACGVTASLKAKVAASPEPVMAAMMNGPKDPPQRAISLELFKTSTKALINPVAFKPAAKTPAVMMIPMTEP